MKEPELNFDHRGRRLLAWPGRAGLYLLLLLSRIPQAQQQFQDQIQSQLENPGGDQIAPSPAAAIPQTVAEKANPGTFQVLGTTGPSSDSLDQPFQWGKIIFRPHFLYRFLYGNGIQSAPGQQQKSIIQEFSPGILVDLGPDWVADYTPTYTHYSSRQFQDGVDQSAVLRGGTAFENWTLGLSQTYSSSTSPTVETGGQVSQAEYLTALNATVDLNDALSVDLGANQNIQSAQSLQGSREWSSLDWLNFKFWTRLNIGVGAGAGYDNLDIGAPQTFEQAQTRLNWRVSDRLSLTANAGLEDRQFKTVGGHDLISPVYGAAVQYQPFAQTEIQLNVNSTVSQSLFANLVTDNTSFGVVLDQRLLGKLHLNLNGNYTINQYDSSMTAALSRTDDYYSFNARLSWPFLQRGSMGLTYAYSHNQSTEAGLTYGSTQLGFDIGYAY